MGVNHLWEILSPVGQRMPLDVLKNKTLAIDLSGWILESLKQKELSQTKSAHIRNLFFRISRLLQLGAKLVFVIEGDAPSLKKDVISKRLQSQEMIPGDNVCSRKRFSLMLQQCKELIESLGLTCIKSCGEAEATCAYLNEKNLVDGCITNDNDAFLYGAKIVYRDFSIDPKDPHVFVYRMDDIEKTLNLDRKRLVGLALLLGCDYGKTGVLGIGKEKAMKLLQKLKDVDILKRFEEWRSGDIFSSVDISLLKRKILHCDVCNHPGSSKKHKSSGCTFCKSEISCLTNGEICCPCSWHQAKEMDLEINISKKALESAEFPSQEIIVEYLQFKENINYVEVDWKRPSSTNVQNIFFQALGWTVEKSREKIIPLITLWQLTESNVNDTDELILIPVRIIKEVQRNFQECYIIEWKLKDDQLAIETTTELKNLFEKRYPKIVEAYLQLQTKKKYEKKKSNVQKRQKNKDTECPNQLKVREDRTTAKLSKYFNITSNSKNELKTVQIMPDCNLPDELDLSLTSRIAKTRTNETVSIEKRNSVLCEISNHFKTKCSNAYQGCSKTTTQLDLIKDNSSCMHKQLKQRTNLSTDVKEKMYRNSALKSSNNISADRYERKTTISDSEHENLDNKLIDSMFHCTISPKIKVSSPNDESIIVIDSEDETDLNQSLPFLYQDEKDRQHINIFKNIESEDANIISDFDLSPLPLRERLKRL